MEKNKSTDFNPNIGIFITLLFIFLYKIYSEPVFYNKIFGDALLTEEKQYEELVIKLFMDKKMSELYSTLYEIRDSYAHWRSIKSINLLSAYFDRRDNEVLDDAIYLRNYLLNLSIDDSPALIDLEPIVFDKYLSDSLSYREMGKYKYKLLSSRELAAFAEMRYSDSIVYKPYLINIENNFMLLRVIDNYEDLKTKITGKKLRLVNKSITLIDSLLEFKKKKGAITVSYLKFPKSQSHARFHLILLLHHFNKFKLYSKLADNKYVNEDSLQKLDSLLFGQEALYPKTKKYIANTLRKYFDGLGFSEKALTYLQLEISLAENPQETEQLKINYLDEVLRNALQKDSNATAYLKSVSINAKTKSALEQIVELQKKDNQSIKNTLIIFVIAFLIVLLGFALYYNITMNKLNKSQLQANKMLEKQNAFIRTLKRELSHRVKNNLLAISSRIQSQVRSLRKNGQLEMAVQFMEVNSRIHAIQLLHVQLEEDEDTNEVNLQKYFNNLLIYLKQAGGYAEENFEHDVNIPSDINVPISLASRLGLAITELALNAFKYADVVNKKFSFLSWQEEPDNLSVVVSDNGPGIPHGYSMGLGLKIVKTIIENQLKGSFYLDEPSRGTKWVLKLPLREHIIEGKSN